MISQESSEPVNGSLPVPHRNRFAKQAVDRFLAEAMPESLARVLEKLKTDEECVQPICKGTGEARRVVGSAKHKNFEIRFLVYVEARNLDAKEGE